MNKLKEELSKVYENGISYKRLEKLKLKFNRLSSENQNKLADEIAGARKKSEFMYIMRGY